MGLPGRRGRPAGVGFEGALFAPCQGTCYEHYHGPSEPSWDCQGDEAARLAWAREGALLALCSARGGLVLYNVVDGSRMEISDRHSRGVTCAVWSGGGRLVLGGKDQQVRISSDPMLCVI